MVHRNLVPRPAFPIQGRNRNDDAEVANKLNAKNDREQEAFIGRTANLLTTRSDYYTLAIVANASGNEGHGQGYLSFAIRISRQI